MIEEQIDEDVIIYTDESTAFGPLENRATVNHSVKGYVRNMAHIHGLESFWSDTSNVPTLAPTTT